MRKLLMAAGIAAAASILPASAAFAGERITVAEFDAGDCSYYAWKDGPDGEITLEVTCLKVR